MDGRPAARYDDGTGRVDDDGRVTLTRAHTVRVYVGRSRSRSLPRERASELDAMTTMRRRSRGPVATDGWMDERDEGGLSIHLSIVPSFDRSFDG